MGTTSSSPAPEDADFGREGRLLEINSGLGPDHLLLTSLVGKEGLSQLFQFELELLSSDVAIVPESLVGTPVSLRILPKDQSPRYLHGYISRFHAGSLALRDFRSYRAEVVPWLWFLSRDAGCRIFQHKSIPEIVKDVFDKLGFTDYEFRLQHGPYPALDFCVQYRETTLSFVSRLLERAGIFYYFRYEEKRHLLVLGDANSFFTSLDEPRVAFADSAQSETLVAPITKWEHSWEFRTGRWTQSDFSFKTPSTSLLTSEKTLLAFPLAGNFERFDYPGGYTESEAGKRLTRTLMEAEEARYHLVRGESEVAAFVPGRKFVLAVHPIPDERDKEYVLSTVRHEAKEASYFVGMTDASYYKNDFEAMEAKVTYRPYPQTPKPFVQGPQTATVVGPAGETIHTDKHGRVKLQFHWDREGKHDDNSSCWVRVSQAWAGSNWGGVNIPHVGHEVVVSFLEGNPDLPVVTGRVYNAEKTKNIGLPANKTQSAMRDHSGNEFLMEGKAGAQDIRLTAVKDQNVTVENDYNETVSTGNRKIDVKTGTHTETIKGNTTIRVTTGNYTHHVEKGIADVLVAGNITETYQDHQTTNVFSDVVINSLYSKIFLQAAMAIQLTSGASQITLDKEGTITIVGKNIRILGNDSVKVSGDEIGISASNEAKIGVGGQNATYDKQKTAVAGSSISSSAAGEHDITGAVVKIN